MTFLQHPLLMVTGKGGVGRTTATAALAIASARAGRDTAAIELNGLSALSETLGLAGRDFTPRSVRDHLITFSLSSQESVEDFGRRKLHLGPLTRVVFRNRLTRALIDGVPGMHDLMQVGKLRDLLAEPLADDHVVQTAVLDAPATGHGITLLDCGHTMAELTRVGPFFEESRQIERWFADPARTGIAVVTLPEHLPVRECLDLIGQLGDHERQLAAVVVNQVTAPPLADPAIFGHMLYALDSAGREDLSRILGDASGRFARERAALAELRAGLDARGHTHIPVVRLPRLTGAPDLERLADAAIASVATPLKRTTAEAPHA